jgi:hypothetical protein
VAAQRRGELGGPLVGEEQARSVQLDDLGGAGDRVTQPVGPLAVEEPVAGAPDDEGRHLEAPQGWFGDAPAVLGWQRWRELDEPVLDMIRGILAYAAEAGRIDHRHADTFAHIMLAAANEVALMIARADDPATALAAGESAFAEFLDRLLGEPVASG